MVDLRTLRPLDTDTVVESVSKTHRAVVIEEGWKTGGIGAEIASQIQYRAFDYMDAPVERVAGEEVPMPYSKALEDLAIPGTTQVLKAVRTVLGS